MQFFDVLKEWATDGTLVIIGAVTLVAIFVISFCFKTSWGQWYNWRKRDEIYGKPGVNVDKQKHPTQQER